MKNKNIVLIGFMGTGKTVTARALSRKIKWEMLDLDAEIEKAEKKSIAQIFSDHGEPYFRRSERRELKKALKKKNCVVSTGGGIVLNPLNRRDLKKSSTVICLTATLQTILKRTGTNKKRPLLNKKNPFQTAQNILKLRRPLYRETADFFVPTTGDTAAETAEKILKKLKWKL